MPLTIRVVGVPGPKGSVNAFCVTCGRLGRKQNVVVREESENGTKFRKLIKRTAAVALGIKPFTPWDGPVETRTTIYVPRQKRVKAGVEQDEWVPSHAGPYPIHQQSGDAEKHVRNVHDALMDAGVLADDSQVIFQSSRKVWASEHHPPGADIEVIFVGADV